MEADGTLFQTPITAEKVETLGGRVIRAPFNVPRWKSDSRYVES